MNEVLCNNHKFKGYKITLNFNYVPGDTKVKDREAWLYKIDTTIEKKGKKEMSFACYFLKEHYHSTDDCKKRLQKEGKDGLYLLKDVIVEDANNIPQFNILLKHYNDFCICKFVEGDIANWI